NGGRGAVGHPRRLPDVRAGIYGLRTGSREGRSKGGPNPDRGAGRPAPGGGKDLQHPEVANGRTSPVSLGEEELRLQDHDDRLGGTARFSSPRDSTTSLNSSSKCRSEGQHPPPMPALPASTAAAVFSKSRRSKSSC